MKKIKKIFGTISDTFKSKTDELKKNKEKELEELERLEIDNFKQKDIETQKIDGKFIFKFWIGGAIIAYISYLTFQSLDLIYLIASAFILSIAMESIIDFLSKYMSRGFSILISYILIVAFIILGFVLIVPFVVTQLVDIINPIVDNIRVMHNNLTTSGLDYMIQQIQFLPEYAKKFLIDNLKNVNNTALMSTINENLSNIVNMGTKLVTNSGWYVGGWLLSFFSAIFQILLVFMLAVFFSLEKNNVINFISNMSENPKLGIKINKLYKKLGFWLKGQLMLCVFIGSTVWVLLYTLGMFGIDLPNKFTLALIAGITEFVPILGPILGAVPAILVAIISYGWVGFIVIGITYYIIQWVENNILVPVVMNHALGISPLLIFIAMIIGGQVFGLIGVVLAVPLSVIVNLIFEDMNKSVDIEDKDSKIKSKK